MPLDARIALGVETPKAPDLLQSVGQLMSIKGAMQENALRQVQTQTAVSNMKTAQLEQQQKQREVADEQTFQSTLAKNGGSFPKTFDELQRTAAISPTSLLNKQSKFAEAVKNRSLEAKETLLAHNESLKSLGGSVSGILLLPDGEQDAAYQDFRARALADPSTAKEAAQLSTDWNKDRARSWKWMGNASTTINDEAIKLKDAETRAAVEKRAVDKFAVDMTTANANAEKAAKVNAGTSPTGVTAAEQARLDNEQVTRTETARHNGVQELISGRRENREARALDLKTKGALGQLNPAQSALSKKVAEGDLSIEQLSRLPDKEAIIAGALEINPEWTRNTFATKKAFSDPQSKQSQNLGTISRIVGHIGRFEKNSEELGVSPSLLTGVTLTGTAGALSNDAHAIAGELEKLVSGGVGTVGQIHEWQKELKSSRPGIRKAAIDEISRLIGSQYEGMQQTYKAGTGQELPIDKYVSPEGRKWMAEKGIAGVTAAPAGGSGGNPTATHRFNPATGRIEEITK